MITSIPRREFLRMAMSGIGFVALELLQAGRTAAAPYTVAAPQDLTRACKILEGLILEHARAKDNPWLLIHGIRAMGRGFSLGDGSALEYLCSHYLQKRSVGSETYLYMPIDDEGHPNCFLSEAVLEAEVPLDFAFERYGRRSTVADLVKAAKAMFVYDPATFPPGDLGWSLVVFAHTTSPLEDSWINAYGKQIQFSRVVEFAVGALERATERILTAMHSNSKGRLEDGIDGFSCGGTHLIYGLTACLRFGHNQNLLAERMKPQFDLLIWRLGVDEHFIDDYYDQIAEQYPPDLARMYRLDTKLKFLGHAFEIINYARRFNLFQPSAAQDLVIRHAQQSLLGVIEDLGLEDVGRYAADKVLFNLLVGDACHAYHGLMLTTN